MASLSLPLRLALVAVLVVAGAWTVLLRPTGEVAADPAVTPAAPAPKAAPPATKPPQPKPKPERTVPRDPSALVLAALDEGRAAVLLFSDGRAEEDRQALRVLRGLDRRDGRVRVWRARMGDVGRYEAITRGVPVVASPTILVISPSRTARAITGLTTPAELGQAVGDALDLSRDPLGAARLQRSQAVRRAQRTCEAQPCVQHFTAANDVCLAATAKALQTATAGAAAGGTGLAAIQGARASAAETATAFAAVPAPGPQRAVHAQATALLQRRLVVLDRALASSKDPRAVQRRLDRSAVLRASDRQLRALGYAACG